MLSNDQIKIYNKLGIPLDYGEKNNLVFYNDAIDLVDVGPNIIGNRQKLTREAALHWFKLNEAAENDQISLMIVSGFRSLNAIEIIVMGEDSGTFSILNTES